MNTQIDWPANEALAKNNPVPVLRTKTGSDALKILLAVTSLAAVVLTYEVIEKAIALQQVIFDYQETTEANARVPVHFTPRADPR